MAIRFQSFFFLVEENDKIVKVIVCLKFSFRALCGVPASVNISSFFLIHEVWALIIGLIGVLFFWICNHNQKEKKEKMLLLLSFCSIAVSGHPRPPPQPAPVLFNQSFGSYMVLQVREGSCSHHLICSNVDLFAPDVFVTVVHGDFLEWHSPIILSLFTPRFFQQAPAKSAVYGTIPFNDTAKGAKV